jgi:hypothetical protein
MISQREMAWLAGLIEGEGCFGWNKSNFGSITIGMSDRDVIERAAVILGKTEKIHERTLRSGAIGKKPLFYVRVTGTRAIGWMMTLYSFMGQRRQEKIRAVLATWAARPPKNANKSHCVHGHPLSGANLKVRSRGDGHQRVCLACESATNFRNREESNRRRRERRKVAA